MKTNGTIKRQIIEIDEDLCTGCGDCIPGCAEGALQIVEGKARLISDLFCDGLGACVGHCPVGAMRVIEREAEPYDERKVMETIVAQGPAVVEAHLKHLREHGALDYHREGVAYLEEMGLPVPQAQVGCAGAMGSGPTASGGCPGSSAIRLETPAPCPGSPEPGPLRAGARSRLGNWPVQITLVPINAPYFDGAHLLIAADCTAFATAAFHEELARDKVVLVGCPKLDDAGRYAEKLGAIIGGNDVRSVTVAHMTVPCCFGMISLVNAALAASGKSIEMNEAVIDMDGGIEHIPASMRRRSSL